MSIYIGQPVDIKISCTMEGEPLEGIVSAAVSYRKPDKTTGTWPATVLLDVVRYEASAEDIDQAGTWLLQPLVTLQSGLTFPGTTVSMPVLKRFT